MISSGQVQHLESSDCEKDLGVYVDGNLNFVPHICMVTKTANKIFGIIRRNFKFIGPTAFVQLYKSLVRPHLEYGNVVWSPYTIKDQKMIENVQRRATKLIPELADKRYDERLRALGIPSLQYRRLRADMIQTYKIIHGIDRINLELFFEKSTSTRTRGHSCKLCKQRCKSRLRQNAFSIRVVDNWNNLPENVVNAPNVNTFKSRWNTHWKNHPLKFTPSFY